MDRRDFQKDIPRAEASDPAHPRDRRLERREFLLAGTLGLSTALPGCDSTGTPRAPRESGPAPSAEPGRRTASHAATGTPGNDPVLSLLELGAPPWPTFDPFLFCVHHHDRYPAGNAELGPAGSLAGRNIGEDFAGKDGWSMYHGEVVPGFPRHPHRGFETVTVTRRGYIDHSDSLGATARYGEGDVQWLTAGAGIAHAEMFPLLEQGGENPTELFQIWLNLPARSKFAKPYFSMFWDSQIPRLEQRDAAGRATVLRVIAGKFGQAAPPAPPPDSWAAVPDADVAIWSLRMEAGAQFQLPAAGPRSDRTLYFFAGNGLRVGQREIPLQTAVRLRRGVPVTLTSGPSETEVLLLAGRPIGEPVVARGPFVMNDLAGIAQARTDYQRTQFGGWPWPKSDPVHSRDSGRFAIHADGRKERAV
jgi:redox-sensitive bicupin YhaK (pirin superfamily)